MTESKTVGFFLSWHEKLSSRCQSAAQYYKIVVQRQVERGGLDLFDLDTYVDGLNQRVNAIADMRTEVGALREALQKLREVKQVIDSMDSVADDANKLECLLSEIECLVPEKSYSVPVG